MRLRVLGILGLFSIAIVLAVASAILASASRELTQELQINRVSALNRFAQVAYDSALDGSTAQLQRDMDRYSSLYGEGVLIRTPAGTLASGGLSEDRPDVADALSRARLNLSDTSLSPIEPFGPAVKVVSRPFGTASQVLGEAVLEVDLGPARARLRERWALVVFGAAGVLALFVVGAGRVTGWVLRPVHRLTEAVAELASSGRSAPLREDGPPELRTLSRSFSAMSQTVADSLASQRQFIADAAHQLRNPVGALRLRTDLLGLRLSTDGQREAAASVTAELERVEAILGDLLRLASAEHRAAEGSAVEGAAALPGPVDAYAVLGEAVEHAGPEARRAGVDLRLAPAPAADVWTRCRGQDLADMVTELIGNAVKYAPGTRVTVAVRPDASHPGAAYPGAAHPGAHDGGGYSTPAGGGTVVVEVADGGQGMPADERAVATTRFWRSPQHQAIPGSGLGMAIVDRLARANGGRLVLAENVPHGLVARLELPGAEGQP